jgi:hypothetical protein
MKEAEQYSVGLKAGAVLRKIHTLPARIENLGLYEFSTIKSTLSN